MDAGNVADSRGHLHRLANNVFTDRTFFRLKSFFTFNLVSFKKKK